MARLALAPDVASPVARKDVLVVPLTQEALACDRDRTFVRARPTYDRLEGDDEKLPVTRKVDPEYPREMMEARIAGSVWVEASIAGAGCVRSARAIRLAHHGLGLNALMAVSKWQFDTAPVDGSQMSRTIYIDVRFTLRR